MNYRLESWSSGWEPRFEVNRTMTKIHGYCQRCNAPIFLNCTVDWYGNTVATLNCWNGHYHWINIENIETDLPPETAKDLVAHLSFFSLP